MSTFNNRFIFCVTLLFTIFCNGVSKIAINEFRLSNGFQDNYTKDVNTNKRSFKSNGFPILSDLSNSKDSAKSEVPSLVFNLAKTILGAGILSLPQAVGLFSDQTTVLPYASVVIVIMGLVSGYTFSSIGKTCRLYNVNTFHEAFIHSINQSNQPNYDKKIINLLKNKFIPFIITIKTFFTCLAYSIILGDTFSQLISAIKENLPTILTSSKFISFLSTYTSKLKLSIRSNIIIFLTIFLILPLCLLKNLDALTNTSILGLLGLVYCLVFMIIRYFDKSYLPLGKFYDSINIKPSFNHKGIIYDQRLFIFLATIATAFVAHYNAPKINKELARPTDQRFNRIVTLAFGFATIMYISILYAGIPTYVFRLYLVILSILGFHTFGGNSLGFILNNYSIKDPLALIARLTVGLSILFSYPLTFTALRDGIIDLFDLSKKLPINFLIPNITISLLSILTYLSMKIRNLGLVVSLSGSLIGCLLIYIIPSIMNISNLTINKDKKNNSEILLNYVIIALGSIIAFQGVKATLSYGGGGH